ncbi:MAG: hypothetical protein WD825_14455 [Gemmatimonadaceae bacterium]
MPISPHVLRKLQEALGAEAADELGSQIEGMEANRGDIRELRHEMQLGFARFDARLEQRAAEIRGEIDKRCAEIRAEMDKRFAELRVEMNKRFAELRVEMNERFAKLEAKVDGLEAKLDGLVTKEVLERKLHEQTGLFFAAWGILLASSIALRFR